MPKIKEMPAAMQWHLRVIWTARVLLVFTVAMAASALWNNLSYWHTLKPATAEVFNAEWSWGHTTYHYQYFVQARKYTGSRWREYGTPMLNDHDTMTVWYEPEHPERSFLSANGQSVLVWIFAGAVCVVALHWSGKNFKALQDIENSKPSWIRYG